MLVPALAWALLIPSLACYSAKVYTGRPPSDTVIEQNWTHVYLFGLVGPASFDVGSRCPEGVAMMESKQGFWNQMVLVLTLGIYTPMKTRAVCAR